MTAIPVFAGAVNALEARLIASAGLAGVVIAGYGVGGTEGISEPLLGLDRLVQLTDSIAFASSLPVYVDAGGGYGDPLNVRHTVRRLQRAGASYIQLEDQRYPKQASYHDFREETVDIDTMLVKLRAALDAREPGLRVVARTDTILTQGYGEAVRRLNAYVDVGADVVFAFPSSRSEAERLPSEIRGPVAYPNSIGNRGGRPVLTADEAAAFGYAMLIDPHRLLLAAYWAQRRVLVDGIECLDQDWTAVRLELERTVGLPELYEFEDRYAQLAAELGRARVKASGADTSSEKED